MNLDKLREEVHRALRDVGEGDFDPGTGNDYGDQTEAVMRAIIRSLNEKFARENGFFWLPCPLCAQYFGGHQCGSQRDSSGNLLVGSVPGSEPHKDLSICPECTKNGLGYEGD